TMQREPLRILAVNPGARYIGFAAFRGPELIDWGVRVIRAKTIRGKQKAIGAILAEAIDRYQAQSLVIKKVHGSRTSPALNGLSRTIDEVARRRKLVAYEYSIDQLKTALLPNGKSNRRLLAEHVAATYAALIHDFGKEQANRNPYYLRMFE